MKIKIIPVDTSEPMQIQELLGDKLAELQLLVGGYVEQERLGRYPGTYAFPDGTTQVVPPDGSLLMIVDEEGLLKDKPLNHRASYLYGFPHHGQPICGTAVLIGEIMTDEGPDWGDYPLEA